MTRAVRFSAAMIRQAHAPTKTRDTPWDDFDVAYFSSEALWTYLTVPFLYTYPGVKMKSFPLGKKTVRSGAASKSLSPKTLSLTIDSLSPTLVRMDCSAGTTILSIFSRATGADYASNYRNVDGIIVPTTRRVYAYDAEQHKIPDPLLVAIDMGEITFTNSPGTLASVAG